METIIYLKIAGRSDEENCAVQNPFCHICPVKNVTCLPDGDQLLMIEVPAEAEPTAAWVCELEAYVKPFWGYSVSIETVTDSTFDRWLLRKGGQSVWRASWPFVSYSGFHRSEYAAYLLQRAVEQAKRHEVFEKKEFCFCVIGYEACLPAILAPYMMRTGKLRLLMSAQEYERAQSLQPSELQPEEYLDRLSAAEGIAAHCQILSGSRGYAGYRLSTSTSEIVLDLSAHPGFLPERTCDRLYWIDMDASEEKRRRIQQICPQISYFSMKEEWRTLDTGRKNGYNTIVN